MITINEIKIYLESHSMKPSFQRIAIMEYLYNNRFHPTADDIYSALEKNIPTLSKTTVYNNLRLFVENGVINSIGIEDKNQRFDVNINDHAHFRCKRCGHIIDIPVEQQLMSIMKTADYQIDEIQIYFKGYCKNCITK